MITKTKHLKIIGRVIFMIFPILAAFFLGTGAHAGEGILLNTINEFKNEKWIIKRPQIAFLKHYSDEQKKYLSYAYEKYQDKNFIYMLKAENGTIDPLRQSECYENGKREDSWGFCQIHRGYHPQIVNDSRFFTGWKWQMDECYRLWTSGTVFYGWERFKKDWQYQKKIKSHFKFY